MNDFFATRIKGIPRSFIREILKVSLDPEIISFAGGLPNAAFFPVREIEAATARVLSRFGATALQYSSTEGDAGLRQWIAGRYQAKKGLAIAPEHILITNGSQQGLDLLGKVLLDTGDRVLIEEPGYLGAIQSLSLYRPEFLPVAVGDSGIDPQALATVAAGKRAKMLYAVTAFQNPSGITYSDAVKEAVANIAREQRFLLVEDDPYGELRFSGTPCRSFASFLPEQTVLLGSFSKVVAPGFRLGWLAAPPWLYDKLVIAKQAADLHTSTFAQKIMIDYLEHHDLDTHLAEVTTAYGRQCRAMQEALAHHFPPCVTFTRPEGGMFLWGRLPKGRDAMAFFAEAVKEKAVFVPGTPFYTGRPEAEAMRFSFSCVDPATIEEGVRRLARALAKFDRTLVG